MFHKQEGDSALSLKHETQQWAYHAAEEMLIYGGQEDVSAHAAWKKTMTTLRTFLCGCLIISNELKSKAIHAITLSRWEWPIGKKMP
ncbi:hypothetical protein AA15669_0551 [Saccharibacter floricola DSM 15669]|uniref:Uncharacterized protein n=1 Tax=Saccharibacter floricola DSM 15669 TaxID=1123227 RepID=A0ABQ0NX61_9PROT|nr:hypothetical protein AA15669_0551 [Saccharibacter floricola DSM 15669]